MTNQAIKIGRYDHLPLRDQLAMIRLLCHIDGLETLARFDAKAREIISAFLDDLRRTGK